jgi:hypothetical protein
MNKTYNRILDLMTEMGESEGQRMTRMSRENTKKVKQKGTEDAVKQRMATKRRQEAGVTDDEISGKVTTHRSGVKLKHVRKPGGGSGFERTS